MGCFETLEPIVSAVVIIPARYGSTRFAAKILAAETGRPLVQHVVDQAKMCRHVRKVIVATDDQRIVDVLTPFGTGMRDDRPPRIAAAPIGLPRWRRGWRMRSSSTCRAMSRRSSRKSLMRLVERLENSSDPMATAATPFPGGADPSDPNLVKVVIGLDGRAIYFSASRHSIPP